MRGGKRGGASSPLGCLSRLGAPALYIHGRAPHAPFGPPSPPFSLSLPFPVVSSLSCASPSSFPSPREAAGGGRQTGAARRSSCVLLGCLLGPARPGPVVAAAEETAPSLLGARRNHERRGGGLPGLAPKVAPGEEVKALCKCLQWLGGFSCLQEAPFSASGHSPRRFRSRLSGFPPRLSPSFLALNPYDSYALPRVSTVGYLCG